MLSQEWVDKYPELYGPSATDPDEGHGNIELQDELTKQFEKIEGFGSLFSTWSERHAFITGVNIGITLSEMVTVPVPTLWFSEAHYFRTGVMAGFIAKKLNDPELAKILIMAMVKR